jgi:hypothetical protein
VAESHRDLSEGDDGAMTEDHLELLKALAMHPTRSIAANLSLTVSELELAGYVTLCPEGWTATALGCATIEQNRVPHATEP